MDSQFAVHIANAMSTVTILSCFFLKVPQITHIKERRSAEGIFVQALLMEITGFSIVVLYNFTNRYNILTYLEYPIILVQMYFLLYYVLKFKNILRMPIVTVATVFYVVSVCAFALEYLPKTILKYLMPFCIPLNAFAKITYIYGIVKAQNADAVSLHTWLISIATNMARIFTVFVDSRDSNLMLNFFLSTLLSTGVLFATLYYQNKCDNYPVHAVRRRVKRKSDMN